MCDVILEFELESHGREASDYCPIGKCLLQVPKCPERLGAVFLTINDSSAVKGTGTFRSHALSLPETKVPSMHGSESLEGTFAPGSESTGELSLPW